MKNQQTGFKISKLLFLLSRSCVILWSKLLESVRMIDGIFQLFKLLSQEHILVC